jgi:hypothetical protein
LFPVRWYQTDEQQGMLLPSHQHFQIQQQQTQHYQAASLAVTVPFFLGRENY